jgi:hypothetical protein
MGSAEMSRRSHFWIRLGAVVVIAASAWIPRGMVIPSAASLQSGEAQTIHASVTAR